MRTWTIEVKDRRVAGAAIINTWAFEDRKDLLDEIKITHLRMWESNGFTYNKEVAVVASKSRKRFFSREEARKIYRAILKKANAIPANDLYEVVVY